MIESINLYQHSIDLKKNGTRLNSINSGLSTGKKDLVKDSPADFHVAKSLEQRVRNSEVALRNVSTASNILSIADGGIQNAIDRLISIKNEAIKYHDGSFSDEQKEAIISRMNAVGEEILDILNTTKFNGYEVFNSNGFEFQVGSDSTDKLSIDFDLSELNLNFSEDPLVDIAILMDNSGSLGEEQEGIVNNLSDLVNGLESENVNLALGLTRFGADENGGAPIVGELTTDSDDFINNIWNQNTLDGYFEPTFNAITDTAENMEFRAGSSRYIMVVGDEDPNQGTDTEADALNSLNNINGKIITVTEPYFFNEFSNLTENANGIEIDINNDFSSVLAEVQSQIIDSAEPDFITQIKDNLNILLGIAQKIGDVQNRLSYKEENLSKHILNTETSRSRIEDIDFARESMNKIKSELLLQTSTNVMKQQLNSMSYILQLFN